MFPSAPLRRAWPIRGETPACSLPDSGLCARWQPCLMLSFALECQALAACWPHLLIALPTHQLDIFPIGQESNCYVWYTAHSCHAGTSTFHKFSASPFSMGEDACLVHHIKVVRAESENVCRGICCSWYVQKQASGQHQRGARVQGTPPKHSLDMRRPPIPRYSQFSLWLPFHFASFHFCWIFLHFQWCMPPSKSLLDFSWGSADYHSVAFPRTGNAC